MVGSSDENGAIKVFTGNANPELALEVCRALDMPLSRSSITRASGGEKEVTIDETVRGDDVFIIQPTSTPISENILELMILIDAVRRASARSITAVIPYFGYARHNRKKKPRDPIPAKLLANVVTVAGATHALVVDLHHKQVESFFDIPVDTVSCIPLLSQCIREHISGDLVVVSPDSEGVARAREVASAVDAPLAIVFRRRKSGVRDEENADLIGDVRDKTAVVVDDIVDTGRTAATAAAVCVREGAKEVYFVCTHAVLSEGSRMNLEEAPIKEIITTNTVRIRHHKLMDKLTVLSAAPLIAETIRRIHWELSLREIPESVLHQVLYEDIH